MKINGSNGSNINFVEQRSNSFEEFKKGKNETINTGDKYEQKIANISYVSITKGNESMGILQVASSAVESLQKENKNLQNLIQKSNHFPEQKKEFEIQFEATSERMLDIVDNTLFGQTQVFYTPIRLIAGNEEFHFSLGTDFGIEDFSMQNEDELKVFEKSILDMQQNIAQTKQYVEVASFNALASIDVSASYELENVLGKIFDTSKEKTESISKYDLSKAHNVDSLKDKISLLLGE